MSPQQDTPNHTTITTSTALSVEAPPCVNAPGPSEGSALVVSQQASSLLPQGLSEDASNIARQEAKALFAAQAIEDDNEYNSDDSEYDPPPEMSASMLQRGEGNVVKVGLVSTADGTIVKRPPK